METKLYNNISWLSIAIFGAFLIVPIELVTPFSLGFFTKLFGAFVLCYAVSKYQWAPAH